MLKQSVFGGLSNSPIQTPESAGVQISRARHEGLSRQRAVISRRGVLRVSPSHNNRSGMPGRLPGIENFILAGAGATTSATLERRLAFGNRQGLNQDRRAVPPNDFQDDCTKSNVVPQAQQDGRPPTGVAPSNGHSSMNIAGLSLARKSALGLDVPHASYGCDTCLSQPCIKTNETKTAVAASEEQCRNSQYVLIQIGRPS